MAWYYATILACAVSRARSEATGNAPSARWASSGTRRFPHAMPLAPATVTRVCHETANRPGAVAKSESVDGGLGLGGSDLLSLAEGYGPN